MSAQRPMEGKKLDPMAWLATFSDLITLLLTFFVLLISMSSMDTKTLRATFGFFDEALGVLEKVASGEVHQEALLPISSVMATQVIAQLPAIRSVSQKKKKSMSWAVERIIDKNNLEGLLEAKAVPGGLKLSLLAGMLFEDRSSRLRPQAKPILEAVADLLRSPELSLSIEGWHGEAESVADPWRLSTERVLSVCQDLIFRQRVSPERLAVAAYGPGWSEDTLSGRPEKLNLVFTWNQQPEPKE